MSDTDAARGWYDTVDWQALATRYDQTTTDMIHHEHADLRGSAFTAEALRRVLANPGSGLTPTAEHEHLLQQHAGVDKANLAHAETKLARVRRDLDASERWAREELITDDGFAQSCVLSTIKMARRALDGDGTDTP
ncbi:MAG: hypothetical protein ACRDQA_01950 [Nocardioidaceae bacterium]